MVTYVLAGIGSKDFQGDIETYWHDKRGAKKAFDAWVASKKYRFVYLAQVVEGYPHTD